MQFPRRVGQENLGMVQVTLEALDLLSHFLKMVQGKAFCLAIAFILR
ncbi:hypothetical protein SYNPCC7002_A2001 [Picosynechococcus sp. PCC 7002]|nr:hypothetical protein SYNPCC7002_A2001 [Picosynechococcus sp. PCC 7002]